MALRWTVRKAEHGRDGFERLTTGLPSLVLLDLTGLVLDGFTFLRGCGRGRTARRSQSWC